MLKIRIGKLTINFHKHTYGTRTRISRSTCQICGYEKGKLVKLHVA